MRHVLPIAILLAAGLASPARAQSEASISLGAAISSYDPTGQLGQSATSIGPLIRINTGPGLGPTIGFDWYWVGVETATAAQNVYIGRIRVRPVMVGLAYNVKRGKYWFSASVVGGWAFVRLTPVEQGAALLRSTLRTSSIGLDAGSSLVWRPQLGMWYDASPRVGLSASIARIGLRPTLRIQTDSGLRTAPLDATCTVLTFGLVYGIF